LINIFAPFIRGFIFGGGVSQELSLIYYSWNTAMHATAYFAYTPLPDCCGRVLLFDRERQSVSGGANLIQPPMNSWKNPEQPDEKSAAAASHCDFEFMAFAQPWADPVRCTQRAGRKRHYTLNPRLVIFCSVYLLQQ
jgi:hypothetical protein